ncbi:MAG: hypothetical protein WBE26_01635 [Phycisphaerae bacterium]
MSRQRKGAYLTLLAVGAAALAVDRWILTEGITEPDAAFALGAGGSAPVIASPPPEPTSTLSIPELPFPRGLEPLDQQGLARDLFAPPTLATDRDSSTDKDQRETNGRGGARRANSATFVTQHRLNGVLVHQRLKIAIVDGAWVRIGELVDGCTLAAVSGNEARFQCHDAEAVLNVGETGIRRRD